MGKIYALCGPSGVGKTTFLIEQAKKRNQQLRILTRATTRPIRPGEIEGFEYNFYSEQAFLSKLFAGDFLFPDRWDNYLYAVERDLIEETLTSRHDGLAMVGLLAASQMKRLYGDVIEVIYMYSHVRKTLLSPECLTEECVGTTILKNRLKRKYQTGQFDAYHLNEGQKVAERMRLNFVNLGFVNGEIRHRKYKIFVLENLEEKMEETLKSFEHYRSETSRIKT